MTARVTVLVLNWNNERDTAECLDSLALQTGVALDVCVIDNASADGSGDALRVRYPQYAYLQTGANLGYAGGNNVGWQWAMERHAEWVLVVNNDTVFAPDCVRSLLAALEARPDVAMLSPSIARYDDPSRSWFAAGRFSKLKAMGMHADAPTQGDAPTVRECEFLSGCCLLIRPAAIDGALFVGEYFAYMEDVELGYRLRQAGWRLGVVPAARLLHKVPPEGAEPSPMQIRLRDRNRRRFVATHYTPLWRMAFAAWFLPTRFVHLLRYTLQGDRARRDALIAGLREP